MWSVAPPRGDDGRSKHPVHPPSKVHGSGCVGHLDRTDSVSGMVRVREGEWEGRRVGGREDEIERGE